MRCILELTTDGFVGGADQRSDVGLRPPAIRGALRACWRACQGHLPLKDLVRREAEIFGSVRQARGAKPRQGVRLRPLAIPVETRLPADDPRYGSFSSTSDKALSYLGYGVIDFKGVATRPRIQAGGQILVGLVGPRLDDRVQEELAEAIWLLGALGGVGSRSRRGFGSVQVAGADFEPPAKWPALCKSPEELVEAWQAFLARIRDRWSGSEEPKWTALSPRSRILVWKDGYPDWRQALAVVGGRLQEFRGLLGVPTFKSPQHGPDHDRVYGWLFGNRVDRWPRRAAFGLPHNYQLTHQGTQMGKKADKVFLEPETGGRRASPLWLHVSKLSDGRYVPVIGWLPSLWLPEGTVTRVGFKTWNRRPPKPGRLPGAPPEQAVLDFLFGAKVEVTYRNGKQERKASRDWPGVAGEAFEA